MNRFGHTARGQSLQEYAFAGALIFAVCIAVLVMVAGGLKDFGQRFAGELNAATGDKVSILGADTSGFGGKQQVSARNGVFEGDSTSLGNEVDGNDGNDRTITRRTRAERRRSSGDNTEEGDLIMEVVDDENTECDADSCTTTGSLGGLGTDVITTGGEGK